MFKSSTGNWDLSRILSAKGIGVYCFAVLWAVVKLKAVPNWGELGLGLGGLFTGAGAFIGGKEIAIAKANATTNA
jgi:hypothetical protein